MNTWDIALFANPNGKIAGSMMGWDVTGIWSWQDGFFLLPRNRLERL